MGVIFYQLFLLFNTSDVFLVEIMTNSQQQAQAILDRLAFIEFERCSEIDLNFNHLPAVAGIYAIRHRTDGLLYLGKTNNLSTRFKGGHKAFTWAWLDLYVASDVRIAIETLDL
jgi:GIY-YIG catalytic domain